MGSFSSNVVQSNRDYKGLVFRGSGAYNSEPNSIKQHDKLMGIDQSQSRAHIDINPFIRNSSKHHI